MNFINFNFSPSSDPPNQPLQRFQKQSASSTDTWSKMRTAQRSMSIDNINFLSNKPSHQMTYDDSTASSPIPTDPRQHQMQNTHQTDDIEEIQKDDDDDNIIPWKKLLRKTNSRLNLIS